MRRKSVSRVNSIVNVQIIIFKQTFLMDLSEVIILPLHIVFYECYYNRAYH